MSIASTAATDDSSEAQSIVIEQSHWESAETEIKSWVQAKQDPDFLDSVKDAKLTEVLDQATDAASGLSEFTLALNRKYASHKQFTAKISSSITLGDHEAVIAAAKSLVEGGTSMRDIFHDADIQCLPPIATMVVFTDESEGACLSGALDESSKSRVQVIRTEAKKYLALKSALDDITRKDLDDASDQMKASHQHQ